MWRPPAIESTVKRMERAVLNHFKDFIELNERYFLENLRREIQRQHGHLNGNLNFKGREFTEEIADVIGPARAGYAHTVRRRFSSKFDDLLLSELVRLLNKADSKYMFTGEVHECIDRYLQ